jgi:hypothetical protein
MNGPEGRKKKEYRRQKNTATRVFEPVTCRLVERTTEKKRSNEQRGAGILSTGKAARSDNRTPGLRAQREKREEKYIYRELHGQWQSVTGHSVCDLNQSRRCRV